MKVEDYWTSARFKEPDGWCNVLLCHYSTGWYKDNFTKVYGEIAFGIGIFNKGLLRWDVPNYDMREFDVIAYHEIERENFEPLINIMRQDYTYKGDGK